MITFTPWTHRGCESIFDFDADGRRGWVHFEDDRYKETPRPHWYVVISGSDGRAYRQVNVACKRGRTMRIAVRDALAAFPADVVTEKVNGHEVFGTFNELL